MFCRTSDEAKDLAEHLGKRIVDRLEEQTKRTEQFASIILQAEENFDGNKEGLSHETPHFRELIERKQRDIFDSVDNLRYEGKLTVNNYLLDLLYVSTIFKIVSDLFGCLTALYQKFSRYLPERMLHSTRFPPPPPRHEWSVAHTSFLSTLGATRLLLQWMLQWTSQY